MSKLLSRIVVCFAFLAGGPSCDGPTEPFHSDIDLARATWLESHPEAYTFELAFASSCCPGSGYYRVQVEDGEVVPATDSAGTAQEDFTTTVDSLWSRLLVARESGELNSAHFNWEGVPVQFDYGPWELDGGVGYKVRNFVRSR